MEDLFSTTLSVNSETLRYRVIFDQEKYIFLTEADQAGLATFSFSREHDEWVDHELLPPDIRRQAINALDAYLMKQH
jgi:hypothetical protein